MANIGHIQWPMYAFKCLKGLITNLLDESVVFKQFALYEFSRSVFEKAALKKKAPR